MDPTNNGATNAGAAHVFASGGSSLLGDLNCNGVVNLADIAGFALALTDPPGYATAYPDCDLNNGDLNMNGAVNVGDIGLFVALLTNALCTGVGWRGRAAENGRGSTRKNADKDY